MQSFDFQKYSRSLVNDISLVVLPMYTNMVDLKVDQDVTGVQFVGLAIVLHNMIKNYRNQATASPLKTFLYLVKLLGCFESSVLQHMAEHAQRV